MPTTNSWNNQILAANSPITLNSGVNTVSVSTDAAATTVNICAGGAGDKTLTLGSTNTTSTTNIQSGAGGINIPAFSEGSLVTDASGEVNLVNGTSAQVLTANGAGIAPSYQTIGSGSRTLIQTQTVSGVVTVEFVTGLTGYTYYVLEALNYFFTANSNLNLQVFFTTNAGGSWAAFNYNQFIISNESDFAVFRALGVNSSTAGGVINGFQGTIANARAYGIVKLYGFPSASMVKQSTFSGTDLSNDAINREQLLGVTGTTAAVAVVNGIRIAQNPAPSIPFSGTFRLFGVL